MDKKDKEEFYSPPPKLGTGEQVVQFIWNPETKQFLGRTASSWFKILLFYFIFYVVLCAFWGGLWLAFQAIALNQPTPRFMLKDSLIGSNPGLGYRPMPAEEFVESALIWYDHNNPGFVNWTSQLQKFLKPYEGGGSGNNVVDCSNQERPPPDKVCRVPIDKMSPCNLHPYSYEKGSPCIFLKLNKIFNWVPEYYNDSRDLPSTMPNDLKLKIKDKESKDRRELNMVWVSCEGENAADKENIGPIHLLPKPGFPGYYFPFSNTPNYLSPLVAVWFERPVRGVLINIECKAWAKNIIYDRHDRRGSVHFELMVD